MKTTFTLAIILSATAGIIKLFLQTSGAEKVAKAVQSILGLLLLLTLFGGATNVTIEQVDFSLEENDVFFSTLQTNTMKRVIQIAEEELGDKITRRLEDAFGIYPDGCTVQIDAETLSVSKITVKCSSGKSIYSAYAIKKFLQAEYGGETEVKFY